MTTTISMLAQDARSLNEDDWGSESQIDAQNLFFDQCAVVAPEDLSESSDFFDDNLKATSDELIDEAMKILMAKGLQDAPVAVERIPGRVPMTLRMLGQDALSRDEDDRDSPRQEKAIRLFLEALASLDPDTVADDDEPVDDDRIRMLMDMADANGLSDCIPGPTSAIDPEAVVAILDAVIAATTIGRALDAIPEEWIVNLIGPSQADGCNAMIVPEGDRGTAHRLERRGLCTGRGATRLEALRNSADWLRRRMR